MNFSDRITFLYRDESYYDASVGEYVESKPVEETKPCKLSAMGVTRTIEVFGEISTNVLIARLLQPYRKKFNSVKVNNKPYKVMQESNYNKGVLFLKGDDYG